MKPLGRGELERFLTKHRLAEQFQPRCARIVQKTKGMGWGFHDTLADLYGDHVEEEW
jgi:hypothetical protein